jgi:hypothetical protein
MTTQPSPHLILFVVLSAAACGQDGTQGGSTWIADGKADLFAGAGVTHYALALRSVLEVRSLDDDEVSTATTRMWAVAGLEASGTSISLEFQPCRIELPGLGDCELSIDDGLLQGLSPISTIGTVGSSAAGSTLGTDPAALLLGVDLVDPLESPMPTDADDPALWQTDGDPGIPVRVSECWDFEIYVAARVIFSLLGDINQGGGIAGDADLQADFEIYDDNSIMVNARERAAEAPETEVVSESNRFVMAPLPHRPTCSEVLALGLEP